MFCIDSHCPVFDMRVDRVCLSNFILSQLLCRFFMALNFHEKVDSKSQQSRTISYCKKQRTRIKVNTKKRQD